MSESLCNRVSSEFFDGAEYAVAKILGLFCDRCGCVTTPYVGEAMEWPCCSGCWKGYPA